MLLKLIDAVFGCRHARYSFPMTVRAGSRRGNATQRTGTYVACLDCGKEFRYNWSEMRIGEPLKAARQPVVCEREVGVSVS